MKIMRLGGGWIATTYDRKHRRPCACGLQVYPQLWEALQPAEPIEGVPLDLPADD